jgi:hypothetical protein
VITPEQPLLPSCRGSPFETAALATIGIITTGEAIFPECHALPRVPKIGHSGKTIFPERNTRGRPAHEKEKLHLTATIDGAVYKKIKKLFPECLDLALGEGDLFPRVPSPRNSGKVTSSPSAFSPALGEGPLPRVPSHCHSGKYFLFFCFFLPQFFFF